MLHPATFFEKRLKFANTIAQGLLAQENGVFFSRYTALSTVLPSCTLRHPMG
ncbi:MAG: hypothetical protein Q8K50_13165 [Hydrogenophaga sp.]|nr:hypothetical protein [Hydrogenophaga sp.]